MKKTIAIVTGGDSSELVISLKSADQVKKHIDKEKYEPFIVYIREDDWHVRFGPQDKDQIPIDREDFSFINGDGKKQFDFAFIALHGPPGEDGQLQTILIPLTSPTPLQAQNPLSCHSINLHASNSFPTIDILSPRSVLIKKDPEKNQKLIALHRDHKAGFNPDSVLKELGLPCFVKPNAGGSSFGISRINQAGELPEAVEKALEEDGEVLVETFIPGIRTYMWRT